VQGFVALEIKLYPGINEQYSLVSKHSVESRDETTAVAPAAVRYATYASANA